ncbi:hypothetical protein ACFSNO_13025 [Streptomyces cirratus]
MARTPQMHALRRLAAEHAAARRLGLPVDDVSGLGRRELLGRAAALGLGTVLASSAGASAAESAPAPKAPVAPRPRRRRRSGDIGTDRRALTLKDAGVGCTLYEANPSRVGAAACTASARTGRTARPPRSAPN